MEKSDAAAFAIVGRYVKEYRQHAKQLNSFKTGGQWWKLRPAGNPVPAVDAAEWANLGYLPEEAAPLIADGITPAMVRDAETPARGVTAVAVVRQMYATILPMYGPSRFDLLAQTHQAAALLMGLVGDTSDAAYDAIAPVGERVVDLMHAAVGAANTGSDDTPVGLTTIGEAREVIAQVFDVSDIRLVGPVSERRLAALVETTPDVD